MGASNFDWNHFFQLLLHFSPWILVKTLFLTGFFVYFIFALVVLTQIFAMTRTVSSPFNAWIRLFGFLHLFFAFGLLLFMFGAL